MVDSDDTIFERDEASDKPSWTPISKLGRRYAVLNDLSPLASSVANSFNAPLDVRAFEEVASSIGQDLQASHGWMYQTLHNPSESQIASAISQLKSSGLTAVSAGLPLARINYTV